MASDSRGQAWMVSQRASLDRESLSAPVQHVAHIASTDWQVDPAGPCQQNLLTKQVPSPCSPTQGLGCRWGSRLAWRASSTKWLTLPFSWGRKHGERLRTRRPVCFAEGTAFPCLGSKGSRSRWKFLWIKCRAEARWAV